MCYYTLTYDDYFHVDIFYIELLCNFFIIDVECVIYWYFWSQLFESVKEFHKLQFLISIDDNIHRHQIPVKPTEKTPKYGAIPGVI